MTNDTYTKQMMELYKAETGETEVNVFDFEMWLFDKEFEG